MCGGGWSGNWENERPLKNNFQNKKEKDNFGLLKYILFVDFLFLYYQILKKFFFLLRNKRSRNKKANGKDDEVYMCVT